MLIWIAMTSVAPAYAGKAPKVPLISITKVDFVALEPIGSYDFGLWSVGDGPQDRWTTLCAASANTDAVLGSPPPNTKPKAKQMPYNFKVASQSLNPGFVLYLDGNDFYTGNAAISATFTHADVLSGGGAEVLTDDFYDVHAHDGQFNGCLGGANSVLNLGMSALDLQSALAGTFSANFLATIIGGSSGMAWDFQAFSASITIADIVQVSNLANINLGAYSGIGNVVQAEEFCVYRNSAAARYNVSFSSVNQDPMGNFYLKNAGLSEAIPYTLQFIDSIAGVGGALVGLAPLSGVGDNSSYNCLGGDNAKLTITLTAADLQSSKSDNYNDTIVILVAPE
jgi:spore coat protein U-like protein